MDYLRLNVCCLQSTCLQSTCLPCSTHGLFILHLFSTFTDFHVTKSKTSNTPFSFLIKKDKLTFYDFLYIFAFIVYRNFSEDFFS